MEEMKLVAQDEQVFLRHGYAIVPAWALPVGLVEAVHAQHCFHTRFFVQIQLPLSSIQIAST
jgi:hypothetical protein